MRCKESFAATMEKEERCSPDYPQVLFRDLRRYAGYESKCDILGIGSGSGTAISALHKLGFKTFYCLEADEQQLQRTTDKFKSMTGYQARNIALNDWQAQKQRVDLAIVCSTPVFHMLENGCEKLYQTLKPGGTLAMCLAHELPDPLDDAKQSQDIHDDGTLPSPSSIIHAVEPFQRRIDSYKYTMEKEGRFQNVTVIEYRWDVHVDERGSAVKTQRLAALIAGVKPKNESL